MKPFKIFIALLATLFTLTASAQGEWKWANYWSGTGGTSSDLYNNVTKTAFDEDGNIYVFGLIGGQPTYNGSPLMFINNPQVYGSGKRSSLLAKFDTLGNMLWYKVVKSSESHDCFPYWMEVEDDKVYISGDISLDFVEDPSSVNSVWLYYLDTLITGPQVHSIPADQRRPPYKTGRYTYFATLDLDGNLLDNHFVASFSRKIYAGGVRAEFGLCQPSLGYSPFHVDSDGNTFVYTSFDYTGFESDPYTLIVDGDTNRRYDIYLPGTVDPYGPALFTGMMYKFSPSWELLYGKPMVDHTEGVATSWELLQDSVNSHYRLHIDGMSFAEDNNMYISGHIDLDLIGGSGGDLHQYPIHIYWDSTHYLSMQDISSTDATSFIIKYDTDGEVLWCNQLYTTGSDNAGAQNFAMAAWKGSCYKDNYVYITGFGTKTGGNSQVYFDNESHPLLFYTDNRPQTGFFVKYDASTGQYVNQGIIPAEIATPGQFPAVVNNRVFSFANSNYGSRIYQWGIDGTYINEININSVNNIDLPSTSIIVDDIGNLLLGFSTTSSGSLGNGVSFGSPTGSSSAVFALYHDPEFATPYVGVPEYDGPKPEVRLWPNPATDKITIESEEEFPVKSVSIADMQGQLLAILPVNDVRCTLNVHKLAPGTYIAHVETKVGVADRKFVVGR